MPLEVFILRNFVADFIRFTYIFIHKKRQIRFSSHTLGAVKGNVRTASIARWKARGRLHICDN